MEVLETNERGFRNFWVQIAILFVSTIVLAICGIVYEQSSNTEYQPIKIEDKVAELGSPFP